MSLVRVCGAYPPTYVVHASLIYDFIATDFGNERLLGCRDIGFSINLVCDQFSSDAKDEVIGAYITECNRQRGMFSFLVIDRTSNFN
jgi:hypothetical protein